MTELSMTIKASYDERRRVLAMLHEKSILIRLMHVVRCCRRNKKNLVVMMRCVNGIEYSKEDFIPFFLSFHYRSTYVSSYLSIHLSIYLSIYLYTPPSTHLSISLLQNFFFHTPTPYIVYAIARTIAFLRFPGKKN